MILIAMLAGCGAYNSFANLGGNMRRMVSSYGEKVDENITNEDIRNSRYAYVIGQFSGRNEWLHASEDTDYSKVELDYNTRYDSAKAWRIYQVEPGRYTLRHILMGVGGNTYAQTTGAGEDKDAELAEKGSACLASFEAAAGNLYWLGSLTMRHPDTFNLDMDTEDMYDYVSGKYKNLADIRKLIIPNPIKKGECMK
jgi:hypothetical protein